MVFARSGRYVVAESGAAKTSLYRWFPTKDDLVAAFLEREHRDFFAHWDKVAAASGDRPRQELSAHLKWLAAYITGPATAVAHFSTWRLNFRSPACPGASSPTKTNPSCIGDSWRLPKESKPNRPRAWPINLYC